MVQIGRLGARKLTFVRPCPAGRRPSQGAGRLLGGRSLSSEFQRYVRPLSLLNDLLRVDSVLPLRERISLHSVAEVVADEVDECAHLRAHKAMRRVQHPDFGRGLRRQAPAHEVS